MADLPAIPEYKRSISQDKWLFRIDGKDFKFTKYAHLDSYQMDDFESGDRKRAMSIFGKPESALYKALMGLPQPELERLLKDWMKDSGIDVGESEASES